MHRFCALVFLMVLAGCADLVQVPLSDIPARNPTAPFSSTTRFEASRFAGNWRVREAVQPAPVAINLLFGTGSKVILQEQHVGCSGDGDCEAWGDVGTGQLTAPGRFSLDYAGTPRRDVWVLWVDEGYRTAALGSPDGQVGWILDRGASGGADRIASAREVLAFNGYDISRVEAQK